MRSCASYVVPAAPPMMFEEVMIQQRVVMIEEVMIQQRVLNILKTSGGVGGGRQPPPHDARRSDDSTKGDDDRRSDDSATTVLQGRRSETMKLAAGFRRRTLCMLPANLYTLRKTEAKPACARWQCITARPRSCTNPERKAALVSGSLCSHARSPNHFGGTRFADQLEVDLRAAAR